MTSNSFSIIFLVIVFVLLFKNHSQYDTDFYKLYNDYRLLNELETVKPDQELERVATLRCNDMSTNNFLEHASSDGRSWSDFVRSSGDITGNLGENIGRIGINEKQKNKNIFEGFKSSEKHNKNLLDNWSKNGYAKCENSEHTYYVHLFSLQQL